MRDSSIKKVLLLGSGALKISSRRGHLYGADQSKHCHGADFRGCC